jgi:hypothetical protein
MGLPWPPVDGSSDNEQHQVVLHSTTPPVAPIWGSITSSGGNRRRRLSMPVDRSSVAANRGKRLFRAHVTGMHICALPSRPTRGQGRVLWQRFSLCRAPRARLRRPRPGRDTQTRMRLVSRPSCVRLPRCSYDSTAAGKPVRPVLKHRSLRPCLRSDWRVLAKFVHGGAINHTWPAA